MLLNMSKNGWGRPAAESGKGMPEQAPGQGNSNIARSFLISGISLMSMGLLEPWLGAWTSQDTIEIRCRLPRRVVPSRFRGQRPGRGIGHSWGSSSCRADQLIEQGLGFDALEVENAMTASGVILATADSDARLR